MPKYGFYTEEKGYYAGDHKWSWDVRNALSVAKRSRADQLRTFIGKGVVVRLS